MDKKLSHEAGTRIRALCRQISVAHNLDEEIQAELRAHMEDKLLGYISGEERVTEADALILVREHFGDPKYLQRMLRETHGQAVTLNPLQKMGVIAVLTVFSFFLFPPFLMLPFHAITKLIPTEYSLHTAVLIKMFAWLLPLLLLWKAARYSHDSLENGSRISQTTKRPLLLTGTLLAANLLFLLFFFLSNKYAHLLHALYTPVSIPDTIQQALRFLWTVQPAIVCFIWIRWFYMPGREVMSAVFGFFSWLVFWTLIMYQAAHIRILFMGPNNRYLFYHSMQDHIYQGLIAVALYAAVQSMVYFRNRLIPLAHASK